MITKEKIVSIIKIIKEITQTDDVYLFGSYASGKANENSDLDIAIIKDDISNKREENIAIRRKFFEDYFPMDIIFLNRNQFEQRKENFGNIYHEVFKTGLKL